MAPRSGDHPMWVRGLCLATQRALDGIHHDRSRSFSALAKSIYFSRRLDKYSGARLQDRKKTLAQIDRPNPCR
jgi:hypothetical protein